MLRTEHSFAACFCTALILSICVTFSSRNSLLGKEVSVASGRRTVLIKVRFAVQRSLKTDASEVSETPLDSYLLCLPPHPLFQGRFLLLFSLSTRFVSVSQPKLDADPDIQTSLRWLTTSPKNPMHKIVLFLMRKCRLFKKDETFDPRTIKTKTIFMGSQMVFTVVVSLPTPLLYNSKWTSISLALIVFCCAIWNR